MCREIKVGEKTAQKVLRERERQSNKKVWQKNIYGLQTEYDSTVCTF